LVPAEYCSSRWQVFYFTTAQRCCNSGLKPYTGLLKPGSPRQKRRRLCILFVIDNYCWYWFHNDCCLFTRRRYYRQNWINDCTGTEIAQRRSDWAEITRSISICWYTVRADHY
jgi:hypothetical protein